MQRCISAIVVGLVPFLAGAETASPPTPADIAQAIRRLGDDSFEVRERATLRLWSYRLAALSALEAALDSDDLEVASRARRIYERSRYGIFPDTPDNVARLAVQYREGNTALRRRIILNLIELKADAFPTLMAIGRTETDPGLREFLSERVRQNSRDFVRALVLADDFDAVERILEMAAAGDDGIRDLAAYEMLRGRLDRRIAELRTRLEPRDDAAIASADEAAVRRRLVWFLRTKGDTTGALEVARELDDDPLLDLLLHETGHWGELADRLDARSPKDVESLGHLAAYRRLAGDEAGLEATVAAILKHAERNPEDVGQCAKALFINDRPEVAIALLRESRDSMRFGNRWVAFDHLRTQGHYREALDFARDCLKNDEVDEFPLELRMAEMLFDLGEQDESRAILDRLAERLREEKGTAFVTQLSKLAGVEKKVRHHANARRLAAEALTALDNSTRSAEVLKHLFPGRTELAEVCWPVVREMDGDVPVEESLARLEAILAGPSSADFEPERFARFVERGNERIADAPDAKQAEWHERLSSLLAAHGRPDEAREALVRATSVLPSPKFQLRTGHAFADAGQWVEAERWYAAAVESDLHDPLPLYFRGLALERLDRAAEGDRLKQRAELILRADESRRYALAQELQRRGFGDDAARQRDVIVRTGAGESLTVTNTHGQIGNSLSGKDNLRTAESWERSLLPCLRLGTVLSDDEGLLTVPHLIHKARGRGLLQAGRVDEALAEFEKSRGFTPTDIELPLAVVPELERAGRLDDAEELFRKVFEANERNCAQFPDSARLRNQTAWLAVKANRRLDDALRHARRAVELEPQSAAYLDTLAEVRFARGERDEAIRLMQRCLELEPESDYYQRQLKRFRE